MARPSAPGRSQESSSVRIAPTNADPLASLRVWRITVDLGERRFLIPALPARDWLEVLLEDDLNPEDLFPGLCGPDAVLEVNQLLVDGVVTQQQLTDAIYGVIEQAAGRRWWVALRLCRAIRTNWDRVGGRLAAHGVTPFEVSLSYWLDGAYDTILSIMAEMDAKMIGPFTAKLTMPPPGMAKQVFDENRDAAAAAFRASMNRARQGR